MPSKAKLATRSGTTANTSDNIAKGSKLTFAEMDGNFIGLRDQSFGVVADDSATLDIAAGDTLYIQGGSNVTTSTDSAGVLTINATGEVTASSTTTFTNKTFDANGTGNSLSNVEVADFAAASIVTEAEGISSNDNDTTIPTSAAVKDLVDTSAANTGDITFVGSTINSPSNAAITLDPSGSGTIELNANTNVTGNLTASGSLNTDGIEIHDNNIKASRTNDDLILQTNNTGIVALESNVRVGEDRASGAANATITGGTGQNLSLIGGNADAGEVKVMAGPANGSGETGEIFLKPGASAGVVHVGSGSGTATITSNGAHDLILRTNDGGTEPHIQLIDGANGNINIVPHQGGTGMVSIGNASTVSTGDGGGGRVEIAGMMFEEVGGLSNAGRKNFNAISIPFSADGSTSSDMTIGLDSNADPFIVFNKASDGNNGAKIKVLDGSLLLQTEGVNSSQGNIRLQAAGDITLAPSGNLNLGSDTIVVSGNKMFTDSSNEDFELLANGTGNISLLSQANMNSNKIINVTDPTNAQDAATKAYVDANSGSTGDLSIIGSTISSPSNADLTLTTSGTGDIVLEDLVYSSGTATVSSATHNFGKFTLNPPSANAGDILQLRAGTKSFDANTGFGSRIELRYKNQGTTGQTTPVQGVYIYNENTETSHAVIGTNADADCLDLMIVSNGPGSNNADINFTTTSLTGSTRNIDINLNPGNPTGPAPGRVKLYDGEYAMPYPDGSNGQVISTNGSGTLSFTTPFKVVADDSAAVDILSGGTLYIQGGTNVTTSTDSAGVVTINATAGSGTITALNNQAENRLVSIGSTTTQLDGEANLTFDGSTLGLTGTQTITNTTTNDTLLLTTTEDSSTAAPVITLKRNSSSPADSDYLGQLKFKGENDNDQEVTYAKMTAKISDASDTTEDGLIEFMLKKAGSNNIGARLTSTQLQLLNGTGFEVAGLTFPTGDGSANQVLGTNGSGVLSFRDPTAINIDGGVADSTYTSVPTIDGGTA